METIIQYHTVFAAFIVRIFLGMLFFFQGYDAVFRVKVKNVIQAFESSFSSRGIPKFLTVLGSWFTSYVELIGGLMLIAGLFEYIALYLLGINLIIASIAFGISEPMWDLRHLFPRMVLLIFLLVIPPSWNIWSLDSFLFIK